MWRRFVARCLPLVAALVIAGILVGGVASADISPGTGVADHNESNPVLGVQVDPDSVFLQVELRPNGTGEWRVEYRIRLDNENTTAAFEQHREQIESDPESYRSAFAADIRASVRAAENRTDREMALSNVTVSAHRDRLPQRYGIIVYTFEWEGFGAANASAIAAGDALRGLYLDGETTLLVSWPEQYHREALAPAASETRANGVVWNGPMHFAADQPRIVVSSAGSADGPPGGNGGSPGDGDSVPGEGMGPTVVGLGVVVLGVVGLGGAMYYDYLDVPDFGVVGGQEEAELLSNDEQVTSVLEANDGRMKQQAIADELGWTDAKTSKVIRGMREEEAIETFRVGRENVVTFPDTDPEHSDT